ncbi:choice-of-anchor F family protein [Rhodobacteraceae bacterium N5(2021)]|uniref:Choice-of-anchor F family protein n=1 Tax=Gymnodinialimonas phycosphaerae TaxID=2841589 RepID=A0A975TWJ2_9RHOB|nr:choice-of-anchor F family protein [Gymnodinialimonas phycosphaerae]MBY4892273.1 choice-of-anchor F family protein [Gymnodinialimonas phycosphaerae]
MTWNTDNVVVGPSVPTPEGDLAAVSVVYQGLPDTAETNGQVYYEAPEANSPGLIGITQQYTTGQGTFDGCIRASAALECATGFQTGNRFKLQLTDTGAVDLVFDVNNLPAGENIYQVFGRAVNLTTQMLDSFVVELGYGVGDDFVGSGADDGLSFAQNLELGPNDLTAFTQYPFGLFGDAPTNNFTLDGFFDDERAGFDLDITEDILSTFGMYGAYDDLFGNWLSREMAPQGLLWDDDGDPNTDALVMAYFNEETGLWEVLRNVDVNGEAESILNNPLFFATRAEVEAALGVPLDYELNIEDLANLNLNFGISLADNFQGSNFTLRLASTAVLAPIPLPAGALFLIGGLAALGALRRRRGQSVA